MTSRQIATLKPTYFNDGGALQIQPTFTPPGMDDPSFDLFLISLEQLIEKIFPPHILEELQQNTNIHLLEKTFRKLNENLPFFHYSFSEKDPYTISVVLICPSQYTHGVGRYINDMLSRWLIPGKQLPLVGSRSMDFKFVRSPGHNYYIQETYVRILDNREIDVVQKNLSNILKEIRINILAVYHARYVVSVKSLSSEEKSAVIQENITSLLKIPANTTELNIFDQMQHMLIKISSEEKIDEVERNLSYIMHKRPKFFDRDVFYEIRTLLLQLKDQFLFERDPRHISRIIGFQYLFKKTTIRAVNNSPNERHLSLKLIKTRQDNSSNRYCLGILVTMNLLSDTERFEKRHILETIKNTISDVQYLKDSYVSDRGDDRVRTFYFEIEKQNGAKFTLDEVKKLKKVLPKELKSRVENVVHPIFMPRNEEEVIRNIIVLSKQLKYVKDLPQVIISYDKQTDSQLSFLVIMVRLLKKESSSMKEVLKVKNPDIEITHDETKIIDYLKRKYPKESSLFRVFLNKTPFFRPDYSLDLQKARQKVVSELINLIGEFRDYNGGMIVKQNEILNKLSQLTNCRNNFLLENFFYSLRPGIMQSILGPEILMVPFKILLEVLEYDFEENFYSFHHQLENHYQIVVIGSENSSFKQLVDKSISSINIGSLDLTTSVIKLHDTTVYTLIYKSHNEDKRNLFITNIKNALEFWEKNYECFNSID
jgi:hypothetical protein